MNPARMKNKRKAGLTAFTLSATLVAKKEMHIEQLNGKSPRPFNTRLRALRSSKGLTQETCAPLLGISKRCLEEWERGGTVPTKAAQEGAVMILKKEKKRDSKRKETA